MSTALRLTESNQSLTIDAVLPYEFTIHRLDDSQSTFAASLENSIPTITPERSTWVRDSNGELLFESNKQLLEVAE